MAAWEDYYEILNANPKNSAQDIRKAYGDKALLHHADRHRGAPAAVMAWHEEKMKGVNQAYNILGNPTKRSAYDNDYSEQKAKARVSAGTSTSSTGPPPPTPPPSATSKPGPTPPPVSNPVIEVDQARIVVESVQGQPIRTSFVVRHVSGDLPCKWSLVLEKDGKILSDAPAVFRMEPLNRFPTTITIELPAQPTGVFEGSLELYIKEEA